MFSSKAVIVLIMRVFLLFAIIPSFVLTSKHIVRVRSWTIKDVPYQAAFVSYVQEESMQVLCSGVMVSIHQILTTANCAMEIQKSKNVTVRVGSDSAADIAPGGSTHTITDVIIHHAFDQEDPMLAHSDVAMVRVKEPMTCDHCKAIKLAGADERLKINDTVIITGYGGNRALVPLQRYVDKEVGLVRSVKVVVDEKEKCDPHYYEQFGELSDDQMCARSAGKYGPCIGDQGGAVVDLDKRLHGLVVSASTDCSVVKPAVFIQVGYVRDWIDKQITYDTPFGAKVIAATEELTRLKQNISALAEAIPQLTKTVNSLYDLLQGVEKNKNV